MPKSFYVSIFSFDKNADMALVSKGFVMKDDKEDIGFIEYKDKKNQPRYIHLLLLGNNEVLIIRHN